MNRTKSSQVLYAAIAALTIAFSANRACGQMRSYTVGIDVNCPSGLPE
jgi:hypothetical protein